MTAVSQPRSPAPLTASAQDAAGVRELREPDDRAAFCGAAGASCDERQIDSRVLLEGATRIAIRHHGELYWLRATRQGKLLLTK